MECTAAGLFTNLECSGKALGTWPRLLSHFSLNNLATKPISNKHARHRCPKDSNTSFMMSKSGGHLYLIRDIMSLLQRCSLMPYPYLPLHPLSLPHTKQPNKQQQKLKKTREKPQSFEPCSVTRLWEGVLTFLPWLCSGHVVG